jgi:anti-sigma B factor antagonist
MKIESKKIDNGILILSLSGDLIGENNGTALIEIVNDAIHKKTINGAIDISGIRFMNSSGIGVLITMLTKFRNNDGEMVLINPSEQVKKLLIITKLNKLFSIFETESEALKALVNN